MKTFFRQFPALLLVTMGFFTVASANDAEPSALRERATEHLAEGAWAAARPLFEELVAASPPGSYAEAEARFYLDYVTLSLELAQSGFGRWQVVPEDPWGERLQALEEQAEALRGQAPEPLHWLTAYEYLGEIQTRYRWQDNAGPLGAYARIFAYWAESTDLGQGRREYLRLVGQLAEVRELLPERRAALAPYVENAAGLAEQPEAVQRFQWLWASFLAQYDNSSTRQLRRGTALRQALEAGEQAPTDYYPQALLDFGQWASQYGVSYYGESGKLEYQPDLQLAAETYRKLLALGDLPTPSQRRQAESRLEQIERAELEVLVPYNFQPDTEIHFFLKWRNLDAPTVQVYAVEPELVAKAFFDDFEQVDLEARAVLEEQVVSESPEAPHYAVDSRLRLETELETGAYLIVARSGGEERRSLLLVSSLAMITHTVEGTLAGYAGDPVTGHPVEGATVFSVHREEDEDSGPIRIFETDADGWVSFSREGSPRGSDHLLVTAHPERGVVLARQRTVAPARVERRLQIYSMAERELFRPGETVRAHFWARWSTPGGWERLAPGTEVEYRIVDPRGELVKQETLTLSELGSASFSIELPDEATLGSYSLHYRLPKEENARDSAYSMFRVEAFRTPEIEVAIELEPSPSGVRLVGDVLHGAVEVDYYAGGEVEDAAVELIVRRQRFVLWPWRQPEARQPGFTATRMIRPGNMAEEIDRLHLETDARGRAAFEIATIDDSDAEWTYTLEARVRDRSRREVTAEREVMLSRQGYYARLELEHRLIAPGDRAELEIRLLTADEEPVSDRGTLRVTRERWREVYIHRRRGDQIGAETYRNLPERSLLVSARSDYYLKERGFVTEEVLTEEVETDQSGYARFDFEPEEAGYYNFNWVSRGRRGQPVVAEAALWVTDEETTEIGYRPGGIELIADRGPHLPGEIVPLLISVPSPDRFVLVSIVGEALIESFVVPVEGTSHLIHLEPTPAYQPNVFVAATMVADANVYHDDLEILVPSDDQLLDISLTPDVDGYEPRDTARFRVSVRDAEGDPVATEVAVSVADEALYAIAPRQRPEVVKSFYGEERYNRLRVGGSLQWREFFLPLEITSEEEGQDSPQAALDSKGFEVTALAMENTDLAGYRTQSFSARASVAQMAEPAAAPAQGTSPKLMEAAFTRSDFQSTAFWNPRVVTDESGEATVEFVFPDNLTEWRAEAVAVTAETLVGEAQVHTTTRLPLIARLQAPRFLTEHDDVVLSGTFQNNSEENELVEATLRVEAGIELLDDATQTVEVPAHATRRLEWRAHAQQPGLVEVDLTAKARRGADAIARRLPIVAHGMEVVEGISGRHRGEHLELTFELPEDIEATDVRLVAAPTLATQLFSALPYLIEFPYGCTEQVLSRFLPALTVRRAMRDLGYPLETIDAGIFNGLSPQARGEREDLREVLDEVVSESLQQLVETQKPDGSWPWMPEGASDSYMTGYAVYVLTLAEELGVPLGAIRLDQARVWVERTLTEEELSAAERAWMLHALAVRHREAGFGRPSRLEARAFLRLMKQRSELGPMHLALLALTAKYFGFEEDTVDLFENLANYARESDATLSGASDASGRLLELPQVHWGKTAGYFRWSEGAVETTAMALEALLAVRPEHPWVDEAASWLVRNRTGTYWQNTRATALATLALTSYLKAHEDDARPLDWTVELNGSSLELPSQSEEPMGSWSAPLDLQLPAEQLRAGENRLTIRQPAEGRNFYFSLHSRYFSKEEPVRAAVSELRMDRQVQYLAPVRTLLSGIREEMRPLTSGTAQVAGGDRVEVTLRIETTRDLRYVLIEDTKPAGFEAVQLLSGARVLLRRAEDSPAPADAPSAVPAHQELLDRKIGFLVDRLPAGVWELHYRLRAEAPGDFHGLPAMAEAMYLPEVRGSSDEFRIEVLPEDE